MEVEHQHFSLHAGENVGDGLGVSSSFIVVRTAGPELGVPTSQPFHGTHISNRQDSKKFGVVASMRGKNLDADGCARFMDIPECSPFSTA
jgi:hypothetical protein